MRCLKKSKWNGITSSIFDLNSMDNVVYNYLVSMSLSG